MPASPTLGLKNLKTLKIKKTCLSPERGRTKLCWICQGAGGGHVVGAGPVRLSGPAAGWDVRWPGRAVSSVNKLGSGGEAVRYIFLIIELCTHYETITEPKYIKFQITNTSFIQRGNKINNTLTSSSTLYS